MPDSKAKRAVNPPGSTPGTRPYSPAVAVGPWVFVSGQGGFEPATGELARSVGAQTLQALRNVEAVLDHAGCTLADVLSCLVHLADLDDFEVMNSAYREAFEGTVLPARTTVQAGLLPGMLVEVTATAVRPRAAGRSGQLAPR